MKALLILVFIACFQLNGTQTKVDLRKSTTFKRTSLDYKVYKIDSIDNYYLIYAKKSKTLYKIVSHKLSVVNGNRIKLNTIYAFKLHSSLHDPRNRFNLNMSQEEVTCFGYPDSTVICLEGDSIKDLYYADNIKGLCFIKANKSFRSHIKSVTTP